MNDEKKLIINQVINVINDNFNKLGYYQTYINNDVDLFDLNLEYCHKHNDFYPIIKFHYNHKIGQIMMNLQMTLPSSFTLSSKQFLFTESNIENLKFHIQELYEVKELIYKKRRK